MKTALTAYAKDVARYPLLAEHEQNRLLALYLQTGDSITARRLIESNLRLVMAVARSLGVRSGQAMSDVIQEGNIGLMEAVQRWDGRPGVKFSTFATTWIRGSMLHCLTADSRNAGRELPIEQSPPESLVVDLGAKPDYFMRRRLRSFANSLIGKEREIFLRRMYSRRPLSLNALAKKHRISEVRVRQIEQSVMRRIKKELNLSKDSLTS